MKPIMPSSKRPALAVGDYDRLVRLNGQFHLLVAQDGEAVMPRTDPTWRRTEAHPGNPGASQSLQCHSSSLSVRASRRLATPPIPPSPVRDWSVLPDTPKGPFSSDRYATLMAPPIPLPTWKMQM